MDTPTMRAHAAVLNAAAYAYGYRPIVDKPGCPVCGGDGCETCDWTGLPEPERTRP